MTSFSELLQQGSAAAWLYLPTAVLLGALHGLEPGHSKTMMAAFIVAVRGSVSQAILLGLSAAVSHTAIVWVLALAALTWGESFIGDDAEPVMMIVSGVIVLVLAAWMAIQARRDAAHGLAHFHEHGRTDERGHHEHGHSHGHLHPHAHDNAGVAFAGTSPALAADVAAPATAIRSHGSHHAHVDDHRHDHPHENAHARSHEPAGAPLVVAGEGASSHEQHHAQQIAEKFGGRPVTTGQIILFGLTGGLLPCTAAIAILLICLQVKEFALGVAIVSAFSLGLAAVLVGVGVVAAWGAGKARRSFGWLDRVGRRLPLLSSGLVALIGVAMIVSGWTGLGHAPH